MMDFSVEISILKIWASSVIFKKLPEGRGTNFTPRGHILPPRVVGSIPISKIYIYVTRLKVGRVRLG
jgi:hypothetical protein